jgi:hypothetical protein
MNPIVINLWMNNHFTQCFQDFLLLLTFSVMYLECISLCVYTTWSFLSSVGVYIASIHQIWPFFMVLGAWIQSLMLARQVFYHLGHSAIPFLCWVFSRQESRVLFSLPGFKQWSVKYLKPSFPLSSYHHLPRSLYWKTLPRGLPNSRNFHHHPFLQSFPLSSL